MRGIISADKRKFVTLIMTENCNLKCTYCYETNKTRRNMPLEIAKNIINEEMEIKDYSEMVCFDFFGGEPFLEFENIKILTEFIKKQNYSKPYDLFIGTNGTLVHGEIQQWLLDNKDIVNVGLSFDGNKYMQDINRSNSFDKIDIDFFVKNYPNLIVKMTVSKETLPFIAEGVKFLHNKGFKQITCNLAYGIDWKDKKNEEILEEQLYKLIDFYLKNPNFLPCSMLNFPLHEINLDQSKTTKKFCGAGTHMKTYDIKGNKYPCHFFAPFSAGEKAKAAKGIEFKTEFPKYKLDKKCQDCLLVDICPTCYGSNFLSSGNIFSKTDEFCNLTKIMIKIRQVKKLLNS